jgi:lipoprotein-releasing system permease protein
MGLKIAISEKIIGFFGHITITRYDINNSYENAPVLLQAEDSVHLFRSPAVNYIQPIATKAGILKGAEDFEGVVLKGVDKTYNWDFLKNNLKSGRIPLIQDELRSDSVLISSNLANKLKLQTHEKVRMYFIQEPPKPPRIRTFYIAGIYETGLEEFDKTYLFGDLRHIQSLNGWRNGEVGGYEVFVKKPDDTQKITSEFRENLSYDLDARTVRSQNEQLFQWLDLFDMNLYLIIGIMLTVAIINMVNALLILILDRTNMIGLLKALGASDWVVMKIFIIQSAHIILKGLFWGNLIGIGLCLIQLHFGVISLDPETYYVSKAPVFLNPLHIALLNAGVFVVCVAMLLIPALLVSKISPVRALRYE